MDNPIVEYAFPGGGSTVNSGMELRDYFAAQAMKGIIPMVYFAGSQDIEIALKLAAKITAQRAYLLADAMLTERGK